MNWNWSRPQAISKTIEESIFWRAYPYIKKSKRCSKSKQWPSSWLWLPNTHVHTGVKLFYSYGYMYLLIYQYSILWYICIAQMYGSVQRECFPDMKSINRRYTYKCFAQMGDELARKCFFVIDISIVVGLTILCDISNAYLTPPLLFIEFLVTDFVEIFHVSHAVSQNFILVLNLVGILYTSG